MRSLFLLPPLLLLGCSETGLSNAPPGVDDEALPVGESGDGSDGNGFGSGADDSPWGNLDGGNLPDEYFAVAWRPDPCDGCVDEETGIETGHRLDIVDLHGRVIQELPRPFEDVGSLFQRIEPIDDGRLLVIEGERTDTYYYQPTPYRQRVWIADPYTGETEEIARLTWDRVELPASGVSFPLEAWGELRFAMDGTEPDLLWMVTSGEGYYGSPPQVIRVDVYDPAAEPSIRTLDGLLQVLPGDEYSWAASPASIRIERTEGEVELLIGIEGAMVYADPMRLPRGVVVYRPGDDTLERVVSLRNRMYLADMRFFGDAEIAERPVLLQAGLPRSSCSTAEFALVEPGVLLEPAPERDWSRDPEPDPPGLSRVHGDVDMRCARLGPVLDAAGPTFVYWGDVEYSVYAWPRSRITLSHRGEDVMTWDSLRVGLRETPFRLLGLARVP